MRIELAMKRVAFLLALIPAQAWAVEGATVLQGPPVQIDASSGDDFPHYDVVGRCKTAWPGNTRTAESARTVCVERQNRIAGLSSMGWRAISASARRDCVKRADAAAVAAYNVLYACVGLAAFRENNQSRAERIANVIREQNSPGQGGRVRVGTMEEILSPVQNAR